QPRILVCPNDRQRTRAADFAQLSNTNLSYFVGLDADETKPETILSGDRNITGGTVYNGFLRVLTSTTPADWATNLHVNAGHIGLADGSVQQMTATRLREQLGAIDCQTIRLAIP